MAEASLEDRLLRCIWDHLRQLDVTNVDRYEAAARAIADGASPDDLVAAMRHKAFEAAFEVLYLVTGEHGEHGEHDGRVVTSGWTLVEADITEDGRCLPRADRQMEGVFESLLTSDPTGQEGRDFMSTGR